MDRKVLMMLRIGTKGLSLVELMVAVAILSFGIVILYEAFFTCLNAFSYSQNRLDTQRWMDEKIWQTQDELIRSGSLIMSENTGSFMEKNKNFTWKIALNLIEQAADSFLYKVSLDVSWKEAQRDVKLSQVAYVQN